MKNREENHREELWMIRHRMRMFGTCCDRGTRVPCVCHASVVCPKHGSICEGTHD
jgi:hypothetical protein